MNSNLHASTKSTQVTVGGTNYSEIMGLPTPIVSPPRFFFFFFFFNQIIVCWPGFGLIPRPISYVTWHLEQKVPSYTGYWIGAFYRAQGYSQLNKKSIWQSYGKTHPMQKEKVFAPFICASLIHTPNSSLPPLKKMKQNS